LDTLGKNEQKTNDLGVFSCQETSANQFFSLSHNDELRLETACCFSNGAAGSNVQIKPCDDTKNEKWIHTQVYFNQKTFMIELYFSFNFRMEQ